jgi:hypothetical protein
MTLRMTMPVPESATPARDRRTRFHPRLDLLDEVVAGLLWLQLDVPGDVSRGEIEDVAHLLVTRIQDNAGEDAIESELVVLQSLQFCRPANRTLLRQLARRLMLAVRGA